MKKERLDLLLVAQGLAPSRERAKRLIMAGQVLVDERRVDKAGTTVDADASLRVTGEDLPYVSRGGIKLAKGMETFGILLTGKTAADIGASTGGFTDCMLQNGAARVYAIDVGYGQLDWKLRTDARVVNMERTNIRNVTPEILGTPLDFASIDVAFISLDKVLPVVRTLLSERGEVVALIKPQFEAGKARVGKNGVVRDPLVHEDVVRSVVGVAEQIGFIPMGLTYSPVKGPKGNIEYLLYLSLKGAGSAMDAAFVHDIVTQAHTALDG
ncbi:MAG: TlyA family RNA methyltransferase [Selenomonas artemidis]|nr:TlyA family RNA methyltransferase [Selenomonas artemidis]